MSILYYGIKWNVVNIFVIIANILRNDSSLCEILEYTCSITQCFRFGSVETDAELRTYGQVSWVLSQSLAVGA